MISSDFKTSIRNILRNKVPSAISILGLGIGLGCIILLLALILHETSFDRFIPDHRNVYRILLGNSGLTQYPLAESMKEEFPEVKDFFRYYQAGSIQLKTPKNEIVRDQNLGFADPSVFRILGIRFISGTAASSIGEIAISDESAMKYFGNLSPLGAIIPIRFTDGFAELMVSGVYKSFPSNSTLNPSFMADIKLSEKMFRQFQKSLGDYGNERSNSLDWRYNEFLSYVVLDRNADPGELSVKMGKYKELLNIENKDELQYKLQPVAEIYLGSLNLGGNQFLRQGNPEELKYYEAILILILVISIANFILLERAGVSERIHELGTRKVFGASQWKIRRLIILESNMIVILSLIPAIFVINYGMTFINAALNKTLTSQVFLSPLLWFLLILVVLLTGTLSGWLIGFNYSRMPALKLISGKSLRSDRSNRWNYSFLVLHFTIYMILVSGVIAVSKQIKYSMTGYKGIDPKNILVTDLNSDELKNSFLTICDEMKKIPGVVNTAGGSFIPPFGNFLPVNLAVASGEKVRFDGLIMGEGMTELLRIEVIEGSSFGPYKPGPTEVLINESSAIKYNVKAGENILVFKVRGIVKDFHAHSLHTLIQPMVILQQNPSKMGLIAIKTDGKNDDAVIKKLRELYNQISPDEIFEVRYLTDQIDDFYTREKNQALIIGAFALLATILSVMGLFGISLISISKRNKEIAIRKVNGSSITEILLMLNTDFVKWVLVSIVIAVPASIYLLSRWMDRFAYKTELSWWIFAGAGISAVLIALITVSWQSWRAATRNPVEALRYE
ncbi:MAG: ABC transporter permease [Bacteroidales bacterium]|nr:ABC transporter permease [Bacteroidales bacterium]